MSPDFLSVATLLVILLSFVNASEKYSDRTDNVDVDRILRNERLVKNYKDCLVDKGKCPKDAIELKSK